MNMTRSFKRIHDVIRRIPKGKVATYGQVARLAGLPRHARQVGFALAALDEGARIPWQRVVNAAGRISARQHPNSAERQGALLAREGVALDARGRVPLTAYRWTAKRR